jgi:hypothetical protein
VKKWGLAPAIPCKTKEISLLGRCLSPFFHNERTQEFMLAAVPLERFGRPDEFGALPVSSPALRVATSPVPTPCVGGKGSSAASVTSY